MESTQTQYDCIVHGFPQHRGTVAISNLTALNAILYVAEHGGKWRGLPAHFGNWPALHPPDEPLGEERSAGAGVCGVATSGAH